MSIPTASTISSPGRRSTSITSPILARPRFKLETNWLTCNQHCKTWSGLCSARSNLVTLTQEFAEFIRRNQGGAEQTRTEKAQFAKPFKYRYEQILREGKAHSCTAGESARNGGSEDKNREIYQCANSWPLRRRISCSATHVRGLESMTIQSVVFCGGNHPVIFVPGRGQPAFAPYTCTPSLLLRLVRCDRQVLALFRTLESG